MPKGFTYTATLADGSTVSRYSAGHATPRYTHVVVDSGAPSFAGNASLAEAERATRQRMFDRLGGKSHWGSKMERPQIYPVSAVPGRIARTA